MAKTMLYTYYYYYITRSEYNNGASENNAIGQMFTQLCSRLCNMEFSMVLAK